MPRNDLLTLSPDDLAALSTRGKVKEAAKDLDSHGVTGELDESIDGAVRVTWSDGRTSELPPAATLPRGRCSCGAVGACRHLVRLVLLYQRWFAAPPQPTEPWDPGAIGDDELAKHYRPSTLGKVRQKFDAGILAELARGGRPFARFSVPVCRVRFLVPGDVRYARCDCAGPAPCEHVPLAVWAFRELPADRRGGIVTAGAKAPPAPAELLEALEGMLADLVRQGVAGAGQGWEDRLARLVRRCEEADLVWPGEVVAELLQQHESYTRHDARFEPGRVAELVGELVLRLDAIRQDTGAVPQLLVRGTTADRPVKLGFGEYWGLGAGVRPGRKGVEVAAYLYDVAAGTVVAVTKHVADADEPRDFGALGAHVAVKGSSFHTLGLGVLQLQGGRRTAAGELLPGRSGGAVMTQDRFAWEEIQPPVLVEEFAELEDRLGQLPPSALRPRRLAEDFHVLRVAELRDVRFDAVAQAAQAVVADARGRPALIEHPYTTRGRSGAEALLCRLGEGQGQLAFVSGLARRSPAGLVVRPTCLVWQEGDRRTAVQPWVERGGEAGPEAPRGTLTPRAGDPVLDYFGEVQEGLGELALLGLARADELAARRWRELVGRGEGVGFTRLSGVVADLAGALEGRAPALRWDPSGAASAALALAALVRLARDV
ncbi:MAG: hypothetical protein U0797_25000 [Gemmataceae bacterium]